MKISIIGAGNVGATAAALIAQRDFVSEIVLLDIKPGLAEGKAKDIAQSGKILGFKTKIVGVTNEYVYTVDSDIIIITSGVPRKPGMSREELVEINSNIIKQIIDNTKLHSANPIYLIVSNPVDTLAWYTYQLVGGDPNRIIGMGNLLDSGRFAYEISQVMDCNITDIDCWVIGGHGDSTMIPVVSYATVKGINITDLLASDDLDSIVGSTMVGGATLTKMLGTSAWEAPAAAIVMMVHAIVTDSCKLLPCSTYHNESRVFIGQMIQLCRQGAIPTSIGTMFIDSVRDKFNNSIEAIKQVNSKLL